MPFLHLFGDIRRKDNFESDERWSLDDVISLLNDGQLNLIILKFLENVESSQVYAPHNFGVDILETIWDSGEVNESFVLVFEHDFFVKVVSL